jgi:hypothetical protein
MIIGQRFRYEHILHNIRHNIAIVLFTDEALQQRLLVSRRAVAYCQ